MIVMQHASVIFCAITNQLSKVFG